MTMRFRHASIVALVVVITVTTSAVQTCLPGVMARLADNGTADGEMVCDHQNGGDSFQSSGVHISDSPAVCCKTIEPLVLTKPHSLSAPARDVIHWMTPALLAVTTIDPGMYVPATGSPPAADAVVRANPPRYVVLRTFLL